MHEMLEVQQVVGIGPENSEASCLGLRVTLGSAFGRELIAFGRNAAFCDRRFSTQQLTMERLQRLLQNAGGVPSGQGQPSADTPQVDTSEQIYISSLALLKMLKHGTCSIDSILVSRVCGIESDGW